MKDALVHGVRNIFPSRLVKGLELTYRKARVQAVSARYGYPAKKLKVIAVTGTNGKTTTVNFINEILKEAGLKTAMFSTAQIEIDGKKKLNSLNATVGSTALMQRFFLSAKRKKVDYVVMEFPSHAIDQHKLDTVPVEVAIMTNLTQDHLDYHGTMENYAAVKAKLFKKSPSYIVLNSDDEWYDYFNEYQAAIHKIDYGTSEAAEAKIDDIVLYKKGTEAMVTIDHQTKLTLTTALPGRFNAYNMVAAASACYLLGIDLEHIVEGVANLEGIPGRYERVEVEAPYDIIVDYAHTPDALDKLLQPVGSSESRRKILVFGACGDRDASKRPIMGKIAAENVDRIILTDEESYNEDPAQIRDQIFEGIRDVKGGEAKTTEIPDRRDAIKKALDVAKKGDVVYITGMGHEQFRVIRGKKIPWNDVEVVKELFTEKLA